MQTRKTLSTFLKQLRLDHDDERLVDMAQKINISQSLLSAIESSKRHLNDGVIRQIAKVYHLSEEEKNELIYLRDLSSNKMNISLLNMSDTQKETVVNLLSNIDALDERTLKRIFLIIKENKKTSLK